MARKKEPIIIDSIFFNYVGTDEQFNVFLKNVIKDYISEDIYNAYQGQYLKVAIGKGYTTFDRIVELINKYLVDMGYGDSYIE